MTVDDRSASSFTLVQLHSPTAHVAWLILNPGGNWPSSSCSWLFLLIMTIAIFFSPSQAKKSKNEKIKFLVSVLFFFCTLPISLVQDQTTCQPCPRGNPPTHGLLNNKSRMNENVKKGTKNGMEALPLLLSSFIHPLATTTPQMNQNTITWTDLNKVLVSLVTPR